MPLIPGIAKTLAELRKEKIGSAIVTSGVGLFAEFLKEDYGFDGVFANSTVHHEGVVETFGPPIVGRRAKPMYAVKYRTALGVAREDCFAVGDSGGDELMFQEVGRSIAINPRREIQADHVIHGCEDLTRILPYVLRR